MAALATLAIALTLAACSKSEPKPAVEHHIVPAEKFLPHDAAPTTPQAVWFGVYEGESSAMNATDARSVTSDAYVWVGRAAAGDAMEARVCLTENGELQLGTTLRKTFVAAPRGDALELSVPGEAAPAFRVVRRDSAFRLESPQGAEIGPSLTRVVRNEAWEHAGAARARAGAPASCFEP
jgi:hypothetical protein